MAILTTEEIVKATGGELLSENTSSFAGVSIDSRTISEGEVFFALRGRKFDGHDFLEDALLKGDGAVIDSKHHLLSKGKAIIYVKDTLRALQDLAHFLRLKRNIPVIAVTGSNGKTTTKEMTYTILSRRFRVLKNEGNLNNHIGLPLSLTRLAPDDEVVVLELGMNAKGEIKRLCEIAAPSHGVITNIGSAHIGELGSFNSIRSAKLEILQGLTVAVLNADDNFLMEGYKLAAEQQGFDGRAVTFSVNNDSHVRAENVFAIDSGSKFTLRLEDGKSAAIILNIHGLFNVYNALAASAVCLSLGITLEEIKTALESYEAFPMRFEVIKVGKVTLVNDSYNANPSSMEESLKELIRMSGKGRTVAILGDMFELGEFSEKAHRAIGKMISYIGINVFVAVGEMMSHAAKESQSESTCLPARQARTEKIRNQKSKDDLQLATYTFKNSDEVTQSISDIIKHGDVVLIKGSRAMGMEKIVERIGA